MTRRWEPVIGLEIHVQLKTRTKMFCRCRERLRRRRRTRRRCPVCLAFPGALPVPNRRAIEETIKLGLALERRERRARLRDRRARGLPPQELLLSRPAEGVPDQPVRRAALRGGKLAVPTRRRRRRRSGSCARTSRRTRRRTCTSPRPGGIHGATATLVDFNRGGTPLVEIVTEPDIHDAETAKRFLQLLRQTVVELGLSDAELEKGSMRFDVNVSVRPAGSDELRTRTELKNMNSFNFAAKGIEREIARQIRIYEAGGTVEQETLHFDPAHEESPPMRSKEEAQDYRYFPEPDLVPGASAGGARRAAARRDRRAARRADPAHRRHAVVLRRRRARHRRPRPALGRPSSTPAPMRRRRRTCSRTSSSRPASHPRRVDAGELAKLVAARAEIPRAAFDEALAQVGDDGLQRRAVPRAEGGLGRVRARPGDRPRDRGEPRPGRAVPRRQGGPPRLLRRAGDEGDRARPGDRPDQRGERGASGAVPRRERACSASSSAR